MLSVDDALELMLNAAVELPVQQVALSDCLDAVLAQALTTPHDSPPFDKSMMDGFAVNSATYGSDLLPLTITETITAGTVPTIPVAAGNAARIMTGAPLPPNADCVVPIERTQFDESIPSEVGIAPEFVGPERHVLRQGASATSGTELLAAGTLLKPQQIAVLAEFGISHVPVIRQPSVAVLATGDELIPAEQQLTPGRIRNSNQPMLESQIWRALANPVILGIARDNKEELDQSIRSGLESDVLLLTGGVSAGTLDLVPAALADAGIEQVFHKVRMKPGKPLWFGQRRYNGHLCLVVGLPGNPVSSMICFEVFVRPMLEVLSGRQPHASRMQTATLTQDIAIRGDRLTYYPSTLQRTADGIQATPVAWGGSADLRSTALANGACCLEPVPDGYGKGQRVPVLCWDEV